MAGGCVLVLDVGKTNAKLSVWTREGRCLAAASRPNADVNASGFRTLDVEGVHAWLKASLAQFAREHHIDAIVPIAHGGAAAIIADGQLAARPMSYETPLPRSERYDAARDRFADTGSPRLPNGLNLGAQLYRLGMLSPALLQGDALIVTYPQYWAWLLSGVAASEVSSLGCHTDLWRPRERRFSDLAETFGWARRFAPLRRADEVLGTVNAEWAGATGLSRECVVYCGAHDSNAAFYGVRAHPDLAGRDVTILSTGTWFVAMRAPKGASLASADLNEARDALLNVGVDGAVIPSARFMGGREMEALVGAEETQMHAPQHLEDVLARGAMIMPTFAPGVGPFPRGAGAWVGEEVDGPARRAAAGVYIALVADASLSLIGAREAVVVEGRFADDTSFLRMLAALRRDCDVYALRGGEGIGYGALRLVDPDFNPNISLTRIAPIEVDVSSYAARWRGLAAERAA